VDDSEFMLRLGRLVVVAAWADGEVAQEEFAYLRQMLGHLPGITGPNWVELNELIEKPIEDARQEQILQDMLDAIRSEKDKKLVIDTISELVRVDGVVKEEEKRLLERIRAAVEGKSTGLLHQMGRLVGTFMGRFGD
jgi:uncharacterized tellurite resistance protein B-like protein